MFVLDLSTVAAFVQASAQEAQDTCGVLLLADPWPWVRCQWKGFDFALKVLLIGIPAVYVFETIRYFRLLGKPDTVHLAPIRVKGEILEAMGRKGVALALQAELVAITGMLQRLLGGGPAPYLAPAAGRDTGYYLVSLRQEAPIPTELLEHHEIQVQQELVLKIGTMSIPISEIINTIGILLSGVYVPFRFRYRRGTIRVSMVAVEKQTQLTVHLRGPYAGQIVPWLKRLVTFEARLVPFGGRSKGGAWGVGPYLGPFAGVLPRIRKVWKPATQRLTHAERALRMGEVDPKGNATTGTGRAEAETVETEEANAEVESRATGPIVLTVTRPTENLEELGTLIRDAAVMILEAHGTFKGRSWKSMRCLLDGLNALDEYRRTGLPGPRDDARQCFRQAALDDPKNLEALYYHGVMTMVDRTAESIDEAQRFFLAALDKLKGKWNPQVRAMLHTGLAYCYAQQFHRLAKLNPEVLEQALKYAKKSKQDWRAAKKELPGITKMHPLIPYSYAMARHVDEGSWEDHPERLRRFGAAGRYYQQAIELQPDNGMFYNNLAWVLLKLSEWGETDLPPKMKADGGETELNVAQLAERNFRTAIGLNPNNKLSHANLCLLYSSPWFRMHKKADFERRCRYHGHKALQLDEEYINGHRDLAVALVRYGRLNEAYEYYTKALELAEDPDKDKEIVRDTVRELHCYFAERDEKVPKALLKRWQYPEPSLFLPRQPEMSPAGADREEKADPSSDRSEETK